MAIKETLARLHAATPLIAPSLLACDFAKLGEEIHRVERDGAKVLHLDVMDGHFVPNLSIGVPIVEAVRRCTDLPLDVHLMISNPARYIEAFRKAGADLLTVHIETMTEPRPVLEAIRRLGAGVGISLNPPTPVTSLNSVLDLCDLVLVMSVMPGFGGQAFQPVALDKLRILRKKAGDRLLLSVDGGVNLKTVESCAAAGANVFVAGSALFSQGNYGQFMAQMSDFARSARKTADSDNVSCENGQA